MDILPKALKLDNIASYEVVGRSCSGLQQPFPRPIPPNVWKYLFYTGRTSSIFLGPRAEIKVISLRASSGKASELHRTTTHDDSLVPAWPSGVRYGVHRWRIVIRAAQSERRKHARKPIRRRRGVVQAQMRCGELGFSAIPIVFVSNLAFPPDADASVELVWPEAPEAVADSQQ